MESGGGEVDFGEGHEFSSSVNGNPLDLAISAFRTIGSGREVEGAALLASCSHDLVLFEIGY